MIIKQSYFGWNTNTYYGGTRRNINIHPLSGVLFLGLSTARYWQSSVSPVRDIWPSVTLSISTPWLEQAAPPGGNFIKWEPNTLAVGGMTINYTQIVLRLIRCISLSALIKREYRIDYIRSKSSLVWHFIYSICWKVCLLLTLPFPTDGMILNISPLQTFFLHFPLPSPSIYQKAG